jgi:hypothetical protein
MPNSQQISFHGVPLHDACALVHKLFGNKILPAIAGLHQSDFKPTVPVRIDPDPFTGSRHSDIDHGLILPPGANHESRGASREAFS